jgi:hypothetical protein
VGSKILFFVGAGLRRNGNKDEAPEEEDDEKCIAGNLQKAITLKPCL